MKFLVVLFLLSFVIGCATTQAFKAPVLEENEFPTLEQFGPNPVNIVFGNGSTDPRNLSPVGQQYYMGLYYVSWYQFDEAKDCFIKMLNLTDEPQLEATAYLLIEECSVRE